MFIDRIGFDFIEGRLRDAAGTVATDAIMAGFDVPDNAPTIDAEYEALLVTKACDHLNDPLFSVRAGMEFRHATTLTAYVLRMSRTLEEAIADSRPINSIVTPAYDYELDVSQSMAFLRIRAIDDRLTKYHRHREFVAVCVLSFLRSIVGREFAPLEIRFPHQVRAHAQQFRELLGCRVEFASDDFGIALPLPVLNYEIPTFDPELRKHLIAHAAHLAKEQPDPNPSFRARVEGVLTKALPDKLASSDEVAAELGVSNRTLVRRLHDEATTFREISDDLRQTLATSYLNSGLSVAEVAYLLHYSDQAAFSKAFHRWTGQSPKQFVGRDSKK